MGSKFLVFLPAADVTLREGTNLTKPSYETPLTKQSILVVDNEEVVRRTATSVLGSHGFHVEVAGNGVEALAVLAKAPDIALVLLDLTMPVMTGEQALPLVQHRYPDLPVLLSSGYNAAEVTQRLSSHRIAGILQKPYTASALLSAVCKALQLPQAS